MKPVSFCIAFVVVVTASSLSGQQAPAHRKQSEIDAANRLYQVGNFAEAGKLYSQMAAQKPKDYSASIQLGRIAVLSDRLDDAQNWLEKAITLQPGEVDPKVMLAEVYYRRDNFEKAAASLNGVDVSANPLIISQYPTLNLAKLQSFRGQTPYKVHGDGQSTRLKFLRTDPLPLVSVRVNGGGEVTFSSTPEARRSRSTQTSAGSLAFRNSQVCKALFPAANTLRFGSGGLSPSPSAAGR